MEGAIKCSANYVPLTPISYLERAAAVYGDRTAVVYGSIRHSWEQTRDRCHKLASAISNMGISRGDVVAVISPNTPAIYELHFAIPMAGAVICAITPYCTHEVLADYIRRSKARLIFVHHRFLDVAQAAVQLLQLDQPPCVYLLVVIAHPGSPPPTSHMDYESLLSSGDSRFAVRWPQDEFEALSISYTSGTTDVPKGVIHNHRAAFLNSIATVLLMEMSSTPAFLWTSPIYHCNGWSFLWAVAALGGANVFLREETMSAKAIFDAIVEHGITNLAGATPVLNMITKALPEEQRPLPRRVSVLAGGSPPPPDVLLKMEEQGFSVTHSGGQTETYCAAIYCVGRPEWDSLQAEDRARLHARQGLPHIVLAQVDVKDPVTMASVPRDGETVGEVVYRGNNVMSGYLDRKATEEAFRGGWFHSGDLGVKHPDGYIEFKDRLRDRVVRGGRTVGTIEIEGLIYGHPAVKAAAVVEAAGGMLCAFAQLKEGCHATESEILEFCRERLPEELVPEAVVFDEIPVTSTGKTKKVVLREKANAIFAGVSGGGGNEKEKGSVIE